MEGGGIRTNLLRIAFNGTWGGGGYNKKERGGTYFSVKLFTPELLLYRLVSL